MSVLTIPAHALANVSDYEADGADARAHGYGIDRNPYAWNDPSRGVELEANAVKRMAWDRGHSGEPGYRVRLVEHSTMREASRVYPTLAAVAEAFALPVERVTPDRFGFALFFGGEGSASIVTIGGLTDQAGALA